jgi:hypothetical protein
MTKKDFFRIIIKLFGLYWLISSVFSTGQLYFLTFLQNATAMNNLMSIFILLVEIVVFYILIIKTDLIVEWLKLDAGFDDELVVLVGFGLDGVLKLGVSVIGGLLILDNIVIFINQAYLALKVNFGAESDIVTLNGYSTYHLAVSFTKVILGYLLLTNYPIVSKLLLKITQNKE